VRDIPSFRRIGDVYRRGRETHHVRIFDGDRICRALMAAGFSVETAQSCGQQHLSPWRRAFFAQNVIDGSHAPAGLL
jgi:hypothetical protein